MAMVFTPGSGEPDRGILTQIARLEQVRIRTDAVLVQAVWKHELCGKLALVVWGY